MRQSARRREWSRLVREWRRSGKKSKEFAAESGVNAGTLLWWSSQLRGWRRVKGVAGSTSGGSARAPLDVAELPMVELSCGALGDQRFELELGSGRRLRIPPGFDAEALGRLLAVLK